MANSFDRFLPDWQLGTITLTAGSAAFTATDAMLTLGAIREGDTIFTPSGLTLVIESINDDNNGVLSSPCPPAAAGTFSTRIRFQSDNSRYTGHVAALIHQLSGGNVSALGKLTLEEGDYLRASGAGVIGKVQGKNLDALTELVGVEGKIISFTDADTMVLLDAPPTDTHSNLAQLAALAKANNQFVIMGANGAITLKPIKDLTEVIAEKYKLPEGGTVDQLIDATGAASSKADLPISTATQNALNAKANEAATQNALSQKLNLSGGQMTGTINGRTPPNSGNNQHGFFCGASFGSYDSTYNRSAPFVTRAQSAGSQFALSMKFMYSHAHESNPGATYSGTYALGVLNPNGANPGAFNIMHTNADNQANKILSFSGDSGGLNVPGPVSKASGTWKIDHPLDPANKILRHGFVEAPEYVNIYRGVIRLVNGKATVNIDEYFGMMFGTFWAVNTDIMVSALQNQEGGTVVWPEGKMTGGILNITCADEACNDEIAWMVTGRRRDPYVLLVDPNCERGTGRFIPEIDKED